MEAFRDCGSTAYVIVFVAILGALVGFAALLAVVRRTGRMAMVLAAAVCAFAGLVMAVGLAGEAHGRGIVDAATAMSPEVNAQLRAVGYREAGMCRTVGAFGAAPLMLAGIGLVFAAYGLRRR